MTNTPTNKQGIRLLVITIKAKQRQVFNTFWNQEWQTNLLPIITPGYGGVKLCQPLDCKISVVVKITNSKISFGLFLRS